MVWLGSSSYSLYLIHAFVIEMVWRWAVRPLGRPPLQALALEVVLGLSASVAVARVFYRVIERPFLRPSAPPVESPAVREAGSWRPGRVATPELASQS